MSKTVFISYSHMQDMTVWQFKQDLKTAGVTVWIDHESLIRGTPSWEQAIRQAIQKSDAVLYMASPEALISEYAQGEIEIARSLTKSILPVWIAGDIWVNVAPMNMSKAQYIDARGKSYQLGLAQLLRQLGGSLTPIIEIKRSEVQQIGSGGSPHVMEFFVDNTLVYSGRDLSAFFTVSAGLHNFICYVDCEHKPYLSSWDMYAARSNVVTENLSIGNPYIWRVHISIPIKRKIIGGVTLAAQGVGAFLGMNNWKRWDKSTWPEVIVSIIDIST